MNKLTIEERVNRLIINEGSSDLTVDKIINTFTKILSADSQEELAETLRNQYIY